MANELEKNVEGSSRGTIRGIIPTCAWMDWAKPRKKLSGDPRFRADIRPRFLPNTNNKIYRTIQVAGDFRTLNESVGDALKPVLSLEIPELFFLTSHIHRGDVAKYNDCGNHILV
jgi:hypothetical protein